MRRVWFGLMILGTAAAVTSGCNSTIAMRPLTPEQEAWAQQMQRWHPNWQRPYVSTVRGTAQPAPRVAPAAKEVEDLGARPAMPEASPVADFSIEPVEALPTPSADEAASPILAPTENARAPAGPVPATYVVQKGDTLSHIAKRLYGNAEAWKPIYEANKDILPAPEKLHTGMTLKIPPKP